MSDRAEITEMSRRLLEELTGFVQSTEGLCIVKAPPGSGKTYNLLATVAAAVSSGLRCAVAGQTNAQCDDICERLAADHPEVSTARLLGSQGPAVPIAGVALATKASDGPTGPSVTVATTAKWHYSGFEPFDLLLVDEAWQLAWADFMLLGQVAGRFILIGDPGQIPPTVTVSTRRWETSPRAPHQAAPELLLLDDSVPKRVLELPACRRLPADAVEVVRGFYDFPFESWARPGERDVRATNPGQGDGVDAAIEGLADASGAILTLATPVGGPPLDLDRELAALCAELAVRILDRGCEARCDDEGIPLRLDPAYIGITATHRRMNRAVHDALPAGLLEQGLRVDTPERWQGLERPLMIVVHPLTGSVRPSSFDLETGRLCVMASRHRAGLIVVSRDHVRDTLDHHIPVADQPIGRPDLNGRGHDQHIRFWDAIARSGGLHAA